MSQRGVLLVALVLAVVFVSSVCLLGCKKGVGDAPDKAPVTGGAAAGGGPPPGAPIAKGDPSAVPLSGQGGPFGGKRTTGKGGAFEGKMKMEKSQ